MLKLPKWVNVDKSFDESPISYMCSFIIHHILKQSIKLATHKGDKLLYMKIFRSTNSRYVLIYIFIKLLEYIYELSIERRVYVIINVTINGSIKE